MMSFVKFVFKRHLSSRGILKFQSLRIVFFFCPPLDRPLDRYICPHMNVKLLVYNEHK